MLTSGIESTYPKGIRDHRLAFVCTECHKAGENRSTNVHSKLSGVSGKFLSGLPSHTPPDMSGGDRAIYMVPHTEDKVPSMAYRMCDEYNVVDMLVDISGCMSDRRNKEGHTGVDI